MNKRLLILAMLAALAGTAIARAPAGFERVTGKKSVELRGVCANSESAIDQEINNVRARLLGGGDCWWDFNDGRYIVPKVDPSTGQKEVSSIFAASVWLGGVDPAKNLKLACVDYRSEGNEFWPGPLRDEDGKTDEVTCKNWDRHFRVTGDEIRQHLANLANGITDRASIPRGLRGWPAQGNPDFDDVWGFPLPTTNQGLAGFYDADVSGDYDPLKGDYPSIEIRGCDPDRYPDEMIFWIYNDEGSGQTHGRTKGTPIQMEVQVQAFGYQTSDELNDMTFQRYKLINRATERIDSTFFAMWVDPDLGCHLDDYIGCDTLNDLMYCYNQDVTDGQPNCDCPSGNSDVPTYCNDVPIFGVDYFRGPRRPVTYYDSLTMEWRNDSLQEIGMSSFVYYNNPSFGNPDPTTTDPDQPIEFYRYLTGYWKDGTPFTHGGNGKGGVIPTKYAFSEAPNDPAGWSMCTANLPFGDRRTLQASGPFTLLPDAVNELIIGVPWVPDIVYDCPDVEQLLRADKLAQGLFDNCFERLEGPDAPDVGWVEMNQQIIAVLTNDDPTSNNFNEKYAQVDFLAPDSLIRLAKNGDTEVEKLISYKFEGYVIYQLANPNVSAQDFDNADKARKVAQVDLKNNISKIYNWVEAVDPANPDERIYYPEEQVDGENLGIRHSFNITEDRFARTNDKRLINHRKYYYSVVAYSHNSYGEFTPLIRPVSGQQKPFLPGSRRIQTFTVIPRPVVDQVLNSAYGQDGIVITRHEGVGVGNNFVDLSTETVDAIMNGTTDSVLTYKSGRGPLNITIFNPFEVKDGEYEIRLVDGDLTDTKLDDTARWELRRLPDGDLITSARTLEQINEQIIAQYGFSVNIYQVGDVGNTTPSKAEPTNYLDPGAKNGGIDAQIEFSDLNQTWLFGFADQDAGLFHFMKTAPLEADAPFDPDRQLGKLGAGWFVPYVLCTSDLASTAGQPAFPSPNNRVVTPAWTGKVGSNYLNPSANGGTDLTNTNNRFLKLNALPNVDIVLTSDTSKWSRCIVLETANEYYTGNIDGVFQDPTLVTQKPTINGTVRNRQSFDTRGALSVGKKDANNDGYPDPDDAKDANGNPIYGMGWFPGYAIDVETGKRLNIFFGENSCYDNALNPDYKGRDMMWNPNDVFFRQLPAVDMPDVYLGGQHWVYVSNSEYDQCEALRIAFTPELGTGNPLTKKANEIKKLAWAGMLQTATGYQLKSLNDGLIPNDVTIKLRVQNPYQTWFNDADGGRRSGHPRYTFKIDGAAPRALDAATAEVGNALDSIKVVPNPYYGFSEYEVSQLSNIVKITNVPAKCTVTIYSLDGRFIRQYIRDEQYAPYQQITPAVEWDLKNNKGIPVASGVYLIHVAAPGMGERTVKFFGVQRQFDPSGL